MRDAGDFSPDAKSAGRRALRNACLRYLTADDDEAAERATEEAQRAADALHDFGDPAERHGAGDQFRLAHYFDLIAGTSVGGLLALGAGILGITQVVGYGTMYYSFSILAPDMARTFGWKAALAVFVNAAGAMLLFRDQLSAPMERAKRRSSA